MDHRTTAAPSTSRAMKIILGGMGVIILIGLVVLAIHTLSANR
jgi:hypothetical protein